MRSLQDLLRPTHARAVHVRELEEEGAWLERVAGLRASPGFFWLDSARVTPGLGRYSFAGADPWGVLTGRDGRSELVVRRRFHPELAPGSITLEGDPLDQLAALMAPAPVAVSGPGLPFVGGAVGVLGYEWGSRLAGVPTSALDDAPLPDACWLLVDQLWAFDHLEGRTFRVGLGVGADAAEAESRAQGAAGRSPSGSGRLPFRSGGGRPGPPAFFDEDSYAKAVELAKQRICDGDVYQVCLTHRLERPAPDDAWRLYCILRERNPAPFAAYLELPDVTVVGSSPERFLSLDAEGHAESRPIKGTRPRGASPPADRAEQVALRASEKDRAENLMIVDLVRNDLGRVCETGSVHVPELMAIESLATVHQMVSTVRGRLRPDRDVFDLVRAAFPPGSMTGAPKLAAMEILSRLEPVRRGFYSGALGYFDVRGGCDLSVVIRTAFLRDGRATVHTGGGVVADSTPRGEWREAEDKARALLDALSEASRAGA